MNKPEQDVLEELLRHSQPRPVPAPAEVAAAKAAVRAEWQAATGKRLTRRRLRAYAVAATVVIGIFAAMNAWRAPVPVPMRVADVARHVGEVFVLDEQARMQPLDIAAGIDVGQVIVTADDAGLALSWAGGGSLRVDENTRVRFSTTESVFLEHGRVYFDSVPGIATDRGPGYASVFELETEHGIVRHVGTQYMVEAEVARLVVSVRDGAVVVDSDLYEQRVASGEQATLSGSQRPGILSISRFGEPWDWVSRMTPPLDVDGRSLHEFLVWVSRETGLEVRYDGATETIAKEKAILHGTVDSAPMDALRARLATAALDWYVEEGVIHIRE